jgi:hypothetical protein
MRSLLALIVLTTTLTSIASTRNVYDVMYLPTKGTTFGISELALFNGKAERSNSESDISGIGLNQYLGYSIADNFSLTAAMSYIDLVGDVKEDGGGSSTSAQKGLSDLNLLGKYRILGGTPLLDVIAGVVLSTGENSLDVDSDDDTEFSNRDGSHSFILGAQFGHAFEHMQWSFLAQFQRHLEGEWNSDGSMYDTDAYSELSLRGDVLNKIAEKSFIRSYFDINFSESFDDENKDEVEPPQTLYTLGAEYQYLLNADLLLKCGLNYSTRNSANYESFHYWNLIAGANYQF